MSEELRPCPFCGLKYAEHSWDEFGAEYWVCDHCGASSGTIDPTWSWQTRPIEDALNARIAELEAEIERFTAHSDIERQDDKSPNDTQSSTIVYGKESEE